MAHRSRFAVVPFLFAALPLWGAGGMPGPRPLKPPDAGTGLEAERRPGAVAERLPDPSSKLLPAGENDGNFAQTEEVETCFDDRVRDYLFRHGDGGVIDPFVRLELARGVQRELVTERRNARSDAIGGSVWTSIGPTNGAGRIVALATDPTVPNALYAGAAGGGAWKTLDGGSSWIPLTDTLPNLSVGAIAIARSAPSTVYLGTGEGGNAADFIPGIGLLLSTDGGNSWQLPGTVIASQFYRISVSPADPKELVVATNAGALRSTGGQNGPWTTVIRSGSAGAVTGYGDVSDLVRDPSNAQLMYASTYDRLRWCARAACTDPNNTASPTVLKSVDGGATWSLSNTNLPVSTMTVRVGRMQLAIAPSSPSTLYVATSLYDQPSNTEVCHIYKSTDAGATWADTTLFSNATSSIRNYMNGQAWYDNTIVVSPTDPNVVIAAGTYYVRTTDGGTTWSRPPFYIPQRTSSDLHVDAHDLRYDAGGTLYIANDGGVWKSPDQGATAIGINGNLVTRQYYALENDPVSSHRAYGGTQDNGTSRRSDDATSWALFSGGDGFDARVNPYNPSVVYSTVQRGIVLRSLNGTADIPRLIEARPRYGTDTAPFFTRLVLDPSDPATIHTVSTRVWKSTTGGDAWFPLPITTTDGSTWNKDVTISAMAIAPGNSRVMLVAKSTALFRSTDGGTSWALARNGLPSRNILHIEIDRTNADRIYVSLAGTSGPSVWITVNGGLTWTASANGLPPYSAQTVRFDPTDAGTLYCGTDVGVYRSTDRGMNWSRFGTGMPAVSVYDVQILGDGSVVRAATHGRGVWELTVDNRVNRAPAALVTTPSQTVNKGTPVTFIGSTSDPDAGDAVTARWSFPDLWTSQTVPAGVTAVTHVFPAAGIFPVTLSAADAHGAIHSATATVTVREAGDDCASPVVIPAAGPFPWTIHVDSSTASVQMASDPSPVSAACYPYSPQTSLWFSFTPAVTGTYVLSSCGSTTSAAVVVYSGNACGPYVPVGLCDANTTPAAPCGMSSSVTLTAGRTYRILLANYYYNDVGALALTVAQSPLSLAVTGIAPAAGPGAGGTSVVISGMAFDNPRVTIGGVAAASVTKLDAQTILATTPAHAAAISDVVVSDGNVSATLAGGFAYLPSPGRRRGVRH
jgi:photosystem II stability/assembly factor-like uncharacterized protein